MTQVSLESIREAAAVIGANIHRTPMQSFATGAACRGGGQLFLKCENLQKTGAFKARGAYRFLAALDPEVRKKGVVTYSSGNHGGAVSWSASRFDIQATIFVPEDIPDSKRAAIQGYGGRAIDAGRTSLDRKQAAEALVEKTGATIVPPFDHPHIVSGQGTVGLEILEQVPEIDRVWVPVGGGGLLAGVASAIKSRSPKTRILGVEPKSAASMAAAMKAGRPVPIELGPSIADGLRPVQSGELTWNIARSLVDEMVVVEDAWIEQAMWALMERAHLMVEPSGAAALAAYLHLDQIPVTEASTDVVILSGGNIDRNRLRTFM